MAHSVEKKQDKWHLRFTEQPDRKLALVAGDFLYNVRSGLDHVISALVPSKDRPHVMFPILREPVWDIPFAEGENNERTRARERWETVTRNMRPEAVAILKAAQPIDLASHAPDFHVFDLLNRLSNKDRHSQLNVVLTGLGDLEYVRYTRADGTFVYGADPNFTSSHALNNGAEIGSLPGVVKVEVRGTARVAIRVSEESGHVELPRSFKRMLDEARQLAVRMTPFLHASAK